MKSGDIFEFIESSDSLNLFFDNTTERWLSFGSNIFICLAHMKNPEFKKSRFSHSIFFTDGERNFHIRVVARGAIRSYSRSDSVRYGVYC